jgi:hypothetical protein
MVRGTTRWKNYLGEKMKFIIALVLAALFYMVGKSVGGDSFQSGWISFGLFSLVHTIFTSLGSVEEKK